ncbi:hypothetical protein F5Y11DRAFT_347880 [Daldinia sp. FL1419]|nr:hypothetical protein F5Y11DRAFT_347880 [Daldinia sp. FL1419]
MFATLARRMAGRPIPPRLRNATSTHLGELYRSPYKPKKIWPPDFSKLSEKEQFRFERRYKRRVKLATARPRWDKFVRLAQLFSVTFVLIYSVLFMDWQTEHQPFQRVRQLFPINAATYILTNASSYETDSGVCSMHLLPSRETKDVPPI